VLDLDQILAMANFESASKPALGQAKEESGEDEATDDSSDNSSDLEIHTQEEDDQTRFGMYFGAATEVQS
jgi:ribosomal protein L12E/L44/L45/RPP1/RPP2